MQTALILDCEQSFFSLKIRRVLRHGAFGTENALNQKETGARLIFLPSRAYALVSRGSQLRRSPLAARPSYPSNFEENKRLLAVYPDPSELNMKSTPGKRIPPTTQATKCFDADVFNPLTFTEEAEREISVRIYAVL